MLNNRQLTKKNGDENRRSADGANVAFIDLGTNSVRLLVVRINPNGSFSVLFKHKEMVRLGEDEYSKGELSSPAMDRTVAGLALIAGLCRSFDVVDIVAVATAATRDAKNSAEFVARVRCETGIDLRVISGREEARLIYAGVSSGLPLGDRTALFIDIGGGSTEVSVGTASGYKFLESVDCGCVRYTNRFFAADDTGPVSAKVWERLCAQVRKNTLRTLNKLREYKIDLATGSSGTIENLAEIALRRKSPEARLEALPPEERKLRYDDLVAVSKKLRAMPLEKRRQVSGMNPRRADVILAGAAIIQTLMQELGLKEILVSDRGLQHGLLLDYLRTSDRGFPDTRMSVREFSVLQLAKLCNFQESHARHVAALALDIFDSACALNFFTPEPYERELLCYTAWLHDIGMFLSMKNHHVHSRYFIRNAEMTGFYRREIELMAEGAWFHGIKRLNRAPDSSELSEPLQAVARRNGVLLRLCEALDRSHRSLISRAKLTQTKKHFCLTLEGVDRESCRIEITAVTERLPLLNEFFGKDFRLRFRGSRSKVSGKSPQDVK